MSTLPVLERSNRASSLLRMHKAQQVASFERIAGIVSRRMAELLGAHVAVLDNQSVILSCAHPDQSGCTHDAGSLPPQAEHVHIPLNIAGQHGMLVVSALQGEPVSARLAHGLMELVVNEIQSSSRTLNSHERKNAFIHDLLHGLIDDEQTILHEARVLGLDFSPPRAVILIDAAEYIIGNREWTQASDTQTHQRAQEVIDQIVSFFHLPNDTICAHIGAGEVAVLKASNTKNLVNWVDHERATEPPNASWANLDALRRAAQGMLKYLDRNLNTPVSIGIGRYHPGICGPAGSYQDARAALLLGRQFHGPSRVHCLDRLGIAAFIGLPDERTKVDLATYLLSPLAHEEELVKTLTTFFEQDCCPSSTATQLAIHRNTLSYRLDKIAALIGLDARRFDEAVQIRLALLLRSCAAPAA